MLRPVLMLLFPVTAFAAAPMTLQHQGRLADTLGAPIQGSVDLTVTLFDTDAPTDTGFWTRTYSNHPVDNGYYAVTLELDDDDQPLDPADFADGAVWVQTFVESAPMGERRPLASVPFALIAAGGTANGTLASDDGEVCIRTRLDAHYREQRRRIDCSTGADIDLVQSGGVWEPPSDSMRSCKEYLDAGYYDGEGSGQYRIDPDGTGGNAPVTVYCDMITDGGGWTFVSHVDGNYNANAGSWSGLFTNNRGTYTPSRADSGSYSLGATVMDHIDHHEMMFTLDTPDPTTAYNAKKLVSYRYGRGQPSFYSGPVPCGDVYKLNGFDYRLALDGPYSTGGFSNACASNAWYTRANENQGYLALFSGDGAYGVYWGYAMGGNDSWSHDAWIYIR